MSKKGRKSRSVFNRITLTVVLGLFILLVATMLLTVAAVSVIVSFGAVENLWLYGIIIFAISVAIGTGLSFAYSAVMVKITRPYVEGLQKIADCDFSVRIQDSPLLAGLGIAQNFNDMAKKLESVETLREGFISDFSHDYRFDIRFRQKIQNRFSGRRRRKIMAARRALIRPFSCKRPCDDSAYEILSHQKLSCNPTIPVQLLHRNHVLMRRNLKHAVRGSIDNQFSRFYVLPPVIPDDLHAGIRLVA